MAKRFNSVNEAVKKLTTDISAATPSTLAKIVWAVGRDSANQKATPYSFGKPWAHSNSGALSKSFMQTPMSKRQQGEIVWNAPYAEKVYDQYVHSRPNAPTRPGQAPTGVFWAEHTYKRNLNQYEDIAVQNYMKNIFK